MEMFLLEDGGILLNEVAPRPHNSGHYSIEGCVTSQFEQHLRAVMGWPLGSPDLKVGSWCAPNSTVLQPAIAARERLTEGVYDIVCCICSGLTVHCFRILCTSVLSNKDNLGRRGSSQDM